jgi:hypothetical protein
VAHGGGVLTEITNRYRPDTMRKPVIN